MDGPESYSFEIRPSCYEGASRGSCTDNRDLCVRINEFLRPEAAARLYEALAVDSRWGLRLHDGKDVSGIPPTTYRRLPEPERRRIRDVVYAAARERFAFIREELWQPESDVSQKSSDDQRVLRGFLEFSRDAAFLSFMGRIAGSTTVSLAQVIVERYGAGHFLAPTGASYTGADFGFTLDLSARWQPEWGGLLEFSGHDGEATRVYAPRLNAITIYSLSLPRAVSFVQHFSAGPRYSISGQICVR